MAWIRHRRAYQDSLLLCSVVRVRPCLGWAGASLAVSPFGVERGNADCGGWCRIIAVLPSPTCPLVLANWLLCGDSPDAESALGLGDVGDFFGFGGWRVGDKSGSPLNGLDRDQQRRLWRSSPVVGCHPDRMSVGKLGGSGGLNCVEISPSTKDQRLARAC